MPYSPDNAGDITKVQDKLKKTYKNVSDTAARQAIHIFNSVMDESGDEGRAWAGVYSKLNERGLSKKKASSKAAGLFPSSHRVAAKYIEARWMPGDLVDEGWQPGAYAPAAEEGEGSQVPPARDSFGNEQSETETP